MADADANAAENAEQKAPTGKKGRRRAALRPEDVVPKSSAPPADKAKKAPPPKKPAEGEDAPDTDADADSDADAEATEKAAPKKKITPQRASQMRRGRSRDGKAIRSARKRIDKTKRYDLNEGVKLLFDATPKRKFDQTVELVVKLGIDPKKSDQQVRGAISLPNGLGKEVRVICFAEGPDAEAAKEAGAIEVGGEELAQKIQDGWLDFDKAVAHPSMMKHVGKLGRVLGPQGKMPSPKDGTVTGDVATAVKEFRLGKVSFRCDDYGNVHVPVGKASFDNQKIEENIQAFIDHIIQLKPSAAKGIYLQKAVVTTTMGPGVPINVSA